MIRSHSWAHSPSRPVRNAHPRRAGHGRSGEANALAAAENLRSCKRAIKHGMHSPVLTCIKRSWPPATPNDYGDQWFMHAGVTVCGIDHHARVEISLPLQHFAYHNAQKCRSKLAINVKAVLLAGASWSSTAPYHGLTSMTCFAQKMRTCAGLRSRSWRQAIRHLGETVGSL
jgi:hypothetical protein